MATHPLTDATIWMDGYDLSGVSNAVALQYGAEMLDDTVFGDDTRSRLAGLQTVVLEVEGFQDYADDGQDELTHARVGVANSIFTVSAEGGDDGETGFTFRADIGEYSRNNVLGEMAKFTISAEASDGVPGLVRGTILVQGTKTATGDGTGYQVGAIGATQVGYAALHVLSASAGDTLDVVIESDATDAWVGAETTRFTFAQASAVGSEWMSLAGAVTDAWWRATWTIAGTDESFKFAVVLGIK